MASSIYDLIPCQLKLQWVGVGKPTPMTQKVALAGSKGPKHFFIEYPLTSAASEYTYSILLSQYGIMWRYSITV